MSSSMKLADASERVETDCLGHQHVGVQGAEKQPSRSMEGPRAGLLDSIQCNSSGIQLNSFWASGGAPSGAPSAGRNLLARRNESARQDF